MIKKNGINYDFLIVFMLILIVCSVVSSQVFSDYQIQQMTANFVDQFGLNDDEFGEHDGSIR